MPIEQQLDKERKHTKYIELEQQRKTEKTNRETTNDNTLSQLNINKSINISAYFSTLSAGFYIHVNENDVH